MTGAILEPPRGATNDDGFTLVEVLVALALVAIMLTMVTETYRFGRQAWERVEEMDKSTSVASVQSFVADLLAGAMPVVETTPQTGERLVFEGGPQRIRFVANTRGHTDVGGLYLFEIGLDESPDVRGTIRKALIVRQVLYRSGATINWNVASGARERAILTDIADVTVRYLERIPGANGTWQAAWAGQRVLPGLVEMQVKFKDGDPRSWPSLVVEFRLAQ